MFILVFFAVLAVSVSFFCSILEASLLSIVPSYIAQLEDKNPKLFVQLSRLKEHISEPLAAILSLNTIANTVGATGVGAQVSALYGHAYIGVASGIMTVLILTVSEILPKSVGAKYWKFLIPFIVPSLSVLVVVMKPFIWLSTLITRWFKSSNDYSNTKEEIKALAKMGQAAQVIGDVEYKVIVNTMNLNQLDAKDVMTPRTVVHTVKPGMTIKEFDKFLAHTPFSRFPIIDEKKHIFKGYIHKSSSFKGNDGDIVDKFALDMRSFSQDARLQAVLSAMLEDHNHMALIVDSLGNWIGIITLEDILETIIGKEIVDETDTITDMQVYAKMKWDNRCKQKGINLE
ncbi:MAG: CNNM domain-containing protein [Alphaproteobacteria bacterium]|nr:CNNM domain-containing protein [Alphaproteobacteria bacterium]